ncbi:hypothetical protein DQE80_16440, partial [Enterococcus sp. HPCN18]
SVRRRPRRFARGDPATDRAGTVPGLGDQLAFGLAVACAWSRPTGAPATASLRAPLPMGRDDGLPE